MTEDSVRRIMEKLENMATGLARLEEQTKNIDVKVRGLDIAENHLSNFMSKVEAILEAQQRRIAELEEKNKESEKRFHSTNLKAWFAFGTAIAGLFIAFLKDKLF